MRQQKAQWSWKIDLKPLMGKQVRIETRDGIYLRGLLTGVEFYRFELDKRTVRVPTHLQLDKDSEKSVEVARIVRVKVARDGADRRSKERDQ